VAALSPDALQGKRVGVLRFEPGRSPRIETVYERALAHLRDAGATLIDLPPLDASRVNAAEDVVLGTEFKTDLDAYLATTPPQVRTRTLAQLIEFNRQTPAELTLFGQDIFERSSKAPGLDDASYLAALADSKRLAGAEGLARLLSEHRLDLIVAPTTGAAARIDMINGMRSPGSFAALPAVAGYPHVTVPMGDLQGLPVGMSFIGAPWSEDVLLAAGFAFEQRAKARLIPRFVPSLEGQEKAFEPH
jgi:amidase